MTRREYILGRIRAAVGADPGPPGPLGATGQPGQRADVDAAYAALPRPYLRAHHDPAAHDIVALFAERAADYHAVVEQVPNADVPAAVARILAERANAAAQPGEPVSWTLASPSGVRQPGRAPDPARRGWARPFRRSWCRAGCRMRGSPASPTLLPWSGIRRNCRPPS